MHFVCLNSGQAGRIARGKGGARVPAPNTGATRYFVECPGVMFHGRGRHVIIALPRTPVAAPLAAGSAPP
eukprot:2020002-Lingulodinium_polyedra.AAC.1